jgi:hypothetical protein
MHRDMLGVVTFEVTVTALMKVDHEGHYLTDRQLASSAPALGSAAELFLMPMGFEPFPKIIDMAEK